MNSLERINAAINLQPADRTPVIPMVVGWTADFTGRGLTDFLTKGSAMADSLVEAQAQLGYDAIFVYGDLGLEAEAVGSRLGFEEGEYPHVVHYAAEKPSDIAGLKRPDPLKDARMPVVLEACELVSQRIGSEVAIFGLVTGPMTLASRIVGLDSLLYMSVDDNDAFLALLDFATEVCLDFARAMSKTGVHCITVGDPVAAPAILSKSFFRSDYLPRARRTVAEIRKSGVGAGALLIYGMTGDALVEYSGIGSDVLHLPYQTSLDDAFRLLPNRCMTGNIAPKMLLEGTVAEVEAVCSRALDAADGARGFILASGGEIARGSDPENIAAMIRSVRR